MDANQLQDIGFGFNNSTANLYLHAQLARGVRVQLTSYLSSRHHNETWVKDGFILIDELPVDVGPLNDMMRYITLRVGHMEINYGDAHFRRSDNGNAVYNAFIGNYLLDSFTTEIGGEVYVRAKGFMGMGAVTGGEVRGTVVTPGQRGPAFIGKVGFDRIVRPNLRVRATGSVYKTDRAMNSTLYGGDRAGSRYYWVMENTQATESAQHTSGLLNPGFRNKVTAVQINPFVKYHGLEFFGVIERAEGKAATELTERAWNQYAADIVYRFFPREQVFAGVRFNKATGPAGRHAERCRREPVAACGRLVRDPERADEGRVRDANLRRLPTDQHPQRREVQRNDAGGGRRVLARTCHESERGGSQRTRPTRLSRTTELPGTKHRARTKHQAPGIRHQVVTRARRTSPFVTSTSPPRAQARS